MKKGMLLIMAIALFVAFYEQSKSNKNVYAIVIAIVVFMYGMMRLSAKTPSKHKDKEEHDLE